MARLYLSTSVSLDSLTGKEVFRQYSTIGVICWPLYKVVVGVRFCSTVPSASRLLPHLSLGATLRTRNLLFD